MKVRFYFEIDGFVNTRLIGVGWDKRMNGLTICLWKYAIEFEFKGGKS